MLHHGDCIDVMRGMDDSSVDAIVTDPPYELSFMGKKWDGSGIACNVDMWREALRVLKPGGHLLAFGGTRTYHRMAVAIEDAGFEIRDCIQWLYGAGFPKSADVSKMLDKQAKNKWLNVCKGLDNLPETTIIEAWITYSNSVKHAEIRFLKNPTEAGTSTPKSGSVHDPVLLSVSPENSHAAAIIAELSSSEALPIDAESWRSALLSADGNTTALSVLVTSVESSPASHEAMPYTVATSVQCNVSDSHDVSMEPITKAEEALMTWLGSNKSSKQAATDALCAALTDDLKRTILSRSKTFLSLDTTSQTDFVSATTATITESTVASLISSTVATLRHKAIDKAAGAEREVVGSKHVTNAAHMHNDGYNRIGGKDGYNSRKAIAGEIPVTAPATPEAQQWDGWGTALKPANEPIVVARKPLAERTVAANVLAHGTGALNIDGCRVASGEQPKRTTAPGWDTMHKRDAKQGYRPSDYEQGDATYMPDPAGRWPANVILDEDAAAELDAQSGYRKSGGGNGNRSELPNVCMSGKNYARVTTDGQPPSVGGASRYFKIVAQDDLPINSGDVTRFRYQAKASRRERNLGLPEGMASNHPTVKPIALMRYLVRLVTPPEGTVLDPFAGSGSTGCAAVLEGVQFIGIEQDAEYVEIARRRIEHHTTQARQLRMDGAA